MNGVGRSHVLLELLTRALAVAAPIGSLACSSCPPADPPALSRRDVDPSFADGGRLSAEQCQNVCGASNESTVITCVRDSPEKVMCITQVYSCDGGRRPAGLQDSAHAPCGALEGYLAEAARLEAASVAAFRVLRRELAAHGAPRWMLRAASRAARDERRHARTASALARSFGTSAALPRVEPRAVRELEAVALENVAEGCVRETWGALIALRQGRTAQVPAVRAAMGRIARDEVRHAALAWQVHRWASLRLSRAARARVESAKRTALRALAGEVVHELPGPARHALGLPDAAQSLALIAELERELWHPRG